MHSAIERLQMRQTKQRNAYQTQAIEQQQQFDRATPPLVYEGYEADSGRAIVSADGGQIAVNTNTNGAIEAGTTVAGTLTGGIDSRPCPSRSSSRSRRSTSPVFACWFEFVTVYESISERLPETQFYLKVNQHVVDLGAINSLRSTAYPHRLEVVDRGGQKVVLLQFFTIAQSTWDGTTQQQTRITPLRLHSFAISTSGRILAQHQQPLTPPYDQNDALNLIGVGLNGNFWEPIDYPASFARWREFLFNSQPSRWGDRDSYTWDYAAGARSPDAWYRWLNNGSAGDPPNVPLFNLSMPVTGAAQPVSLAALYGSANLPIELVRAMPQAIAQKLATSVNFPPPEAFSRTASRPLRGDLFADFPALATGGITAQGSWVQVGIAEAQTVGDLLSSSSSKGIDRSTAHLDRWIFGDRVENNIVVSSPPTKSFSLIATTGR